MAIVVIGVLHIPIARAMMCECASTMSHENHGDNEIAINVTHHDHDHQCSAFMACCVVDSAPIVACKTVRATSPKGNDSQTIAPLMLSTSNQAPPKPPPRA